MRDIGPEPGSKYPVDTDENKGATAPDEREEARLTGEVGVRAEGRAGSPYRGPRRGRRVTGGALSAATGTATGFARSLFRFTPAGDAVRIWLPMTMMVVVQTIAYFATGRPLRFVHGLLAVDTYYGLFLVLTWGAIWFSTPADVRRWALAQESPASWWQRFVQESLGRKVFSGGAGMSFIISASLGGLGLAITLLPQGEGLEAQPLRALLCVVGVLMAWTLLHTTYAMYYAHLYYRDPDEPGGLEFPGEEEPAAIDFAYFAFAIGTAFATSDVSVSSGEMRRKVLVHSVLAFFYNATILALVINLVVVGFG